MSRNVVRKTNLIRYTDSEGVQQTLPNTPKNYLKAKGYNLFDNLSIDLENPFKLLETECSVNKDPIYYWYDQQSHFSYIVTPTQTLPITSTIFEDHLEEVIRYLEQDSFKATDFGTTYKSYTLTESQLESISETNNQAKHTTTIQQNKIILETPSETYRISESGIVKTSADSLVLQTAPYQVPPKQITEEVSLEKEEQQYYAILGRFYALSYLDLEEIHTGQTP